MKRLAFLFAFLMMALPSTSEGISPPSTSQTFFDGQVIDSDDVNGIESQWINYINNEFLNNTNNFTIANADSMLVNGRAVIDTLRTTGMYVLESAIRPSNDARYSIGSSTNRIDTIFAQSVYVTSAIHGENSRIDTLSVDSLTVIGNFQTVGNITLSATITADSLSLTSGMKGVGGIFITSAGNDARSTIDSVSVVDLIVSSTASIAALVVDNTTFNNDDITVATGNPLGIVLGGNAGDDFTIDTNVFVVESDDNKVGILTTNPTTALDVFGTVTVSNDVVVGDDLLITSGGSVINWASGDITLTQSTGKLTYGGSGSVEIDYADSDQNNVDINSGNINGTAIAGSSGAFTTLSASGATSVVALTASGVVKTDDATEASNTTTASLQTDGGIAWVKDAYVGDDMFFTDGAVLSFVSGAETITHSDGTLAFGGFGTTITMDTPILDLVTQGNRIDLDTDNDTSIRASAGNVIMFEVAGADDISITANSFNVLSGSIIDLADNATVTFGDGDDATIKWDTSDLAVSAGTANVNVTAGDMTLYDDNNDADVSLKVGTSSTESLTIQVLNGGSNKTAEEVKFITATASGTGDHGKMTFNVDGTDIVTIDDGGLSLGGALAIDTGGNNSLTLNAGTADVVITASDLDVNGNADISGDLTASNVDGILGANTPAAGTFTTAGIDNSTFNNDDITVSTGNPLGIVLGGNAGDDFIVDTNVLVVESDDNKVGILTTNPTTALDVVGTITASVNVAVGNDVLITSAGSVINWASGDILLTQSAGKLTWSGDDAVEIDFADHEITNVDINSGAIDGTTVGAASASSGAFTTLGASGATSVAALTASGVVKTDDATEATSTTAASLQTDGGIAWAKDAYVGDDMFMTAAGVINWGAGDMTVTGGTNILTVAGGTFATAALTTSTIVASGVVKTDDATEASNTTTASLQTDGGIAWVKDAYVGDDMFYTSGVVHNFNAGDVTLTHAAGKLTFGGDDAVEIDFADHEMTNVDINSGAIDGTVIGAASAAAGTFSGLEVKTAGSGLLNIINTSTSTGEEATQRFQVGDGSDFLKAGWSFSRNSSTYGTGYLTWAVDANDDAANVDAGGGSVDEVMTLSATTLTVSGFINSTGTIFVGDTANDKMTKGLTVNQAASDDIIFALKSSDVTHGQTDAGEDDTYFNIGKLNNNGGAVLRAMLDDGAGKVLQIQTYGGTATTGKDTGSRALIEFYATETDGANAQANITANGNVFAVRAYVGSSSVTRFLIDEDGEMFTVVGGATFDDYEDANLIRALETAVSPDKIIKDEWDNYVAYNEQHLIDAGILGAPVSEGGMLNVSQLSRLHNGAIWQNYTGVQQLKRDMNSLRDENGYLRSQLDLVAKDITNIERRLQNEN